MFESILNFIDSLVLPIVKNYPPAIGILIFSLGVSLISNIATKLLVDQERVRELKEEIKKFQKKYKLATKDPEALKKLQEEQEKMMALNAELMRLSFKPMIYTFVPIILIFIYMKHLYGFNGLYHQLYPDWNGVVVYLPIIISKIMLLDFWHWLGSVFYHGGFKVVPNALGWLGWYIMSSMVCSTILRKILGIK
ncbi:protein of unknown function DUF106 transmembrane [Methanocaldococcus infernus ME]|uniref:DUF106 domain-containing protein n=1 Tax=Methanocaldococcus infernus (strain DSM 11812 / JCM 15783 / ME) TaxID=573063 RepID=D5VRS7_METIM|nr:EMC3/TMCO1 family protein [Methanocaldococcus infernus]ADG13280.1 protein of unknown function DUF106 transmembrane [Methanocaldococcus infernus ME]